MLPFLNPTNKKSKKYVVAFKGLNYGEGYEDGEFSETKNISLDEFPCLTQRYARVEETFEGKKTEWDRPRDIYAKDGLIVIDNGEVLYEGVPTGLTVGRGKHHIASVGDYVVIFPDKKYYNVASGEHGSMDVTFEVEATFTASTIDITDGKFPFSKGDTVEIIDTVNNKSATIREYGEKKLTFDANAFTASSTKSIQ